MREPITGAAVMDALGATAVHQSIVVRSAAEYEATGSWVTFNTLALEAARQDADWDGWAVNALPPALGGAWGGEAVTLTALGLLAAESAPKTANTMTVLARIGASRLVERGDGARLSRDILVAEHGWPVPEASRAVEVIQMVPGLTGSGTLGEAWDLSIFRGALQYRNVETPADLLDVIAKSNRTRPPPAREVQLNR